MNSDNQQARITRALGAWARLRASKPIGGLTLMQFSEAVKPSLDARLRVAALQRELAQAERERAAADQVSIGLLAHIVSNVLADPFEAETGELLAEMGVMQSDRSRVAAPCDPAPGNH